MRDRVITLLRLLNGAMIAVALLSVIAMILPHFSEGYRVETGEAMLHGLSVLIPLTVSFIAARRCDSFPVFLLLSAAAVVPVFFLSPALLEKIFFLLFSALILIIRIHGRYRADDDILSRPSLLLMILFGAVFITANAAKNDLVIQVNMYLMYTYALLVIAFLNLSHLDQYIYAQRSVVNIPKKSISRVNAGLLVFFLAMTLAVIIFLPLTGVGDLILGILIVLLTVIVRLVSGALGQIGKDSPSIEEQAEEFFGGSPQFPEIEGSPLWVRTVISVLVVLIVGAVAVGVIILLVRVLIRVIRKLYRTRGEENYEQEFLFREGDQKSRAFGAGRKDSPGLLDFSPNAQIRRQFKRTVERTAKIKSPAYTPDELLTAAHVPEDERRTALHEVYEKARYSEGGADKADVARLKS